MDRTVTAWVTSGDDYLGVVGPFAVDVAWWSEVEPVVTHVRGVLGVEVAVLRLLHVDGGGGGRDGHVTYHVEALQRPAPGLLEPVPVDGSALTGQEELRSPWARAEGLREALGWASDTLAAAGRPVTGPIRQRKTWNLAGLFRLPTDQGQVWLKTTPTSPPTRPRSSAPSRGSTPAWRPESWRQGRTGSCSNTCRARTAGTRLSRSSPAR
ncbi:hypothetical protein [Nonomuraea recticatena]|uniref:hypothetical protein n=1 Tax=Nonomuraea recticatena TaxID=46178 RepID=UPI0036060448